VPHSFPTDIPSSSPLPSDASDFDSDGVCDMSKDQSDTEADVTPLHPLYIESQTESPRESSKWKE